MNDAAWLADLVAHGLIRASFMPPPAIQELRDLTRTRKQLVRQIAQHNLRLQKTLEDANLKIASFVSDLLGVSTCDSARSDRGRDGAGAIARAHDRLIAC